MRSSILLLAILLLFPSFARSQSTEALQSFGSAVAHSENGRLIDALEAFSRTLKIIERDPASESFTAKVHYNTGVTLYNLGLTSEARVYLQKALRYSRNRHVKAHYVLGLAHLKLRQIEEAERSFRSTVVLDNRNGDAWYALGRTYLELNEIEKAKRAFARAVKNGVNDRGAEDTAVSARVLTVYE